MQSNEIQYIAYKADLSKTKEFLNIDEASEFFKTRPDCLIAQARGYQGNHYTGRNIGERWIIFDANMSVKKVNAIASDYKTNQNFEHWKGKGKSRV